MGPNIRCTLTWTKIAGGTESVSNFKPLGYDTSTLVLERDDSDDGGHSVLEKFEADFVFIGDAYNILFDADATDGPDANVSLVVELSLNKNVWETIFTGQVDLAAFNEYWSIGGIPYKITVPILRNDLWQTFINRKRSAVNLMGNRLDGGAGVTLTPLTQRMTTQKIRQLFDSTRVSALFFDDLDTVNKYGIIEPEIITRDEINARNNQQNSRTAVGNVEGSNVVPDAMFTIEWGGLYVFDLKLTISGAIAPLTQITDVAGKIQFNNDAPISMVLSQHTVSGQNFSKLSYVSSHTLARGTKIRFWFEYTGATTRQLYWFPTGSFTADHPNVFDILADTVYDDSTAQALFAHDVGYLITDKIVGADKFYAPYFGDTVKTAITYDEQDFGFRYTMLQGHQVRTRTFTDKPWAWTWQGWFDGLNRIFMLGYGPEMIDGVEKIVVRKREEYYTQESSLTLRGVAGVKRSHDLTKLPRTIKIGYEEAPCEEFGALDDPQSIVDYNTRMQRSGEPKESVSALIAAGLVIEATRRKQLELNRDWRFDNKVFIISIDGFSGSDPLPEFDAHFSALDGFNNVDARYNIRLWPVFNLLRHLPALTVGLTKYPSSKLLFGRGELNVNAEGTMDHTTDNIFTADTLVSQSQDIDVNTSVQRGGALHSDEMLTFAHGLSLSEYKTLRDYRHKGFNVIPIGDELSLFDETFDYTFHDLPPQYRVFIKRISWNIFDQKANFQVWKAI